MGSIVGICAVALGIAAGGIYTMYQGSNAKTRAGRIVMVLAGAILFFGAPALTAVILILGSSV